MKKITAYYNVPMGVELPDDVFEKCMSKERPYRGGAFNNAISNYSQIWWKLPPDCDITGVYNPCWVDEKGEIVFAQPDDEEVYWEG